MLTLCMHADRHMHTHMCARARVSIYAYNTCTPIHACTQARQRIRELNRKLEETSVQSLQSSARESEAKKQLAMAESKNTEHKTLIAQLRTDVEASTLPFFILLLLHGSSFWRANCCFMLV